LVVNDLKDKLHKSHQYSFLMLLFAHFSGRSWIIRLCSSSSGLGFFHTLRNRKLKGALLLIFKVDAKICSIVAVILLTLLLSLLTFLLLFLY